MWSKILIVICFFHSLSGFGQITVKQLWTTAIDSNAIWDVDNIRFCYVYSNQTLRKIDTQGKTVVQESYKSLGEISKIDAQNPLKIACFSEGQQKVCFLDNALARQNDCVDMTELGAELVTAFSASVQTDRIWIYDEPMSKLILVTLRNNQSQISQNIKGLLELGEVIDIREIDNRLFVFDDRKQVLWFDIYGNFMDYVKLPDTDFIYPMNDYFIAVCGNQLKFFDQNEQESSAPLVFEALSNSTIISLKIEGDLLFIQTNTSLNCYRISEK